MPFVDEPGLDYTEPFDFHEGLVYQVSGTGEFGGGEGLLNHTDLEVGGNPIDLWESFDGNAGYQEAFDGPYPGHAATACCWVHASVGHAINSTTVWTGACPPVETTPPSGDRSLLHGSTWEASTGGLPDGSPGNDQSHASVTISGWLLQPWEIFDAYSTAWLDLPELEAEFIANVNPPDGWFVELESSHPIFVGFQVAPDEPVTLPPGGLRTEGVTWLYDAGGWHFDGIQFEGSEETGFSLSSVWESGATPSGTQLAYYNGGLHDWVDVPESWLPTQDPDTGLFVPPADDAAYTAASIPLTVVADNVFAGLPTDNGEGGRTSQTLLVRSIWRTPRVRYYRLQTVIPPRQIWGRPGDEAMGAARVYGGAGTVQTGTVYGGIL